MKHDERLIKESKKIESFVYQLLKWGLFIIIVVRVIALRQSVTTFLDVFILWLVIVALEFILMSLKGIPISFPMFLDRKEYKIFFVLLPILAGVIATLVLLTMGELNSLVQGLITFGLTSGTLFVLLVFYHVLYKLWEKKHVLNDE
jgi:hypothetical protein